MQDDVLFPQLHDPNYLPVIEVGELMEQVFTGSPAIIDNLLYQGTYLLAGAPKIGKSFLVAQIAYHVSSGKPLWGRQVYPGAVLYLALEDQYQRIQERMARMFGVEYQGELADCRVCKIDRSRPRWTDGIFSRPVS